MSLVFVVLLKMCNYSLGIDYSSVLTVVTVLYLCLVRNIWQSALNFQIAVRTMGHEITSMRKSIYWLKTIVLLLLLYNNAVSNSIIKWNHWLKMCMYSTNHLVLPCFEQTLCMGAIVQAYCLKFSIDESQNAFVLYILLFKKDSVFLWLSFFFNFLLAASMTCEWET